MLIKDIKGGEEFSGECEVHFVFQRLTQDHYGNDERICIVKDIDRQEDDQMAKLVLKKNRVNLLKKGDKIKLINYSTAKGKGQYPQPWLKKGAKGELIKGLE